VYPVFRTIPFNKGGTRRNADASLGKRTPLLMGCSATRRIGVPKSPRYFELRKRTATRWVAAAAALKPLTRRSPPLSSPSIRLTSGLCRCATGRRPLSSRPTARACVRGTTSRASVFVLRSWRRPTPKHPAPMSLRLWDDLRFLDHPPLNAPPVSGPPRISSHGDLICYP
jgi:hypothetical protein